MSAHQVGIHVVAVHPLQPGVWRAKCDDCGYVGDDRRDPKAAQADAIGHQGGTLRTVERRSSKPPVLTDAAETPEMFPGAK